MRCRGAVLLTFLLAFLSGPVRAEGPIIDPGDSIERIVMLRDGSVLRGQVVELVPQSHMILLLASGQERRFSWAELRRVANAPTPGAKVAQAAPVPMVAPPSPAPVQAGPAPSAPPQPPRAAASPQLRATPAPAPLPAKLPPVEERAWDQGPSGATSPEKAPKKVKLVLRVPNAKAEPAKPTRRVTRIETEEEETEEPEEPTTADLVMLPVLSLPRFPSDRRIEWYAPGAALFTASYLAAGVTGSIYASGVSSDVRSEVGGVLILPLIGPFLSSVLAISGGIREDSRQGVWALTWSLVDGPAQVAGFALMMAGLRPRVPVKPARGNERAWMLDVRPFSVPAGTGVAVSADF